MSSEKQLRANRLNAQRSTGPKSPEGKAAIRYNAMTHGLLARASLIPGEDETIFQQVVDGIIQELQPVGVVEAVLVDRIAGFVWRLRRAAEVEVGLFVYELFDDAAKRGRADMERQMTPGANPVAALEEMRRQSQEIIDAEAHSKAQERAQEAEAIRDGASGRLGAAFARDAAHANAFTKLSRYEAAIERSLLRSLAELRETQEVRRQRALAGMTRLRQIGGGE